MIDVVRMHVRLWLLLTTAIMLPPAAVAPRFISAAPALSTSARSNPTASQSTSSRTHSASSQAVRLRSRSGSSPAARSRLDSESPQTIVSRRTSAPSQTPDPRPQPATSQPPARTDVAVPERTAAPERAATSERAIVPGPAIANALAVTVTPTSVRVGELAMLTWTSDQVLSAASVRVFDRSVSAFPIGSNTWRALIGVDLDQRPRIYPAVVLATSGDVVLRAEVNLDVRRRVFQERRLQVAPDFVNPPAEMLQRIERERALTNAAYESSAAERLWRETFVRPVPHPANSRFGTRSVYNGERRSPHAGADFLSPAGTPVHAPNAGRVAVARELYFTGNTVIIDHGLGILSLLAHLSRIDVSEGAMVARDQTVGLVGATGRVTGPHLHWGLAVSGARVDPLSLLSLLGPAPQKP